MLWLAGLWWGWGDWFCPGQQTDWQEPLRRMRGRRTQERRTQEPGHCIRVWHTRLLRIRWLHSRERRPPSSQGPVGDLRQMVAGPVQMVLVLSPCPGRASVPPLLGWRKGSCWPPCVVRHLSCALGCRDETSQPVADSRGSSVYRELRQQSGLSPGQGRREHAEEKSRLVSGKTQLAAVAALAAVAETTS